MKKAFKRLRELCKTLILIFFIFNSVFGNLVIAQESNNSAILDQQFNPTATQSQTIITETTPTNSPTTVPPTPTPEIENIISNSITEKFQLKKKYFNSQENVSINIDENENEPSVELIDYEGETVSFDKKISDNSLEIEKPRDFQPGKYYLKITDSQGETTVQDFLWGVLTINTNKSIYLPNESAHLQMGVLDDSGDTICDANLKLEIKAPDDSIFSPNVEKSGLCQGNNVTDKPDYYAYYQTSQLGLYQMTLTNLDNNYQVTDQFEVKESVPFVVERIGPTRIYPLAKYVMTLKIKANQDFQGNIFETVPTDFLIDRESKTENNQKTIDWPVDLQSEEELVLTYTFDAPDVSPQLYLIGPLTFVNKNNKSEFSETRHWQIASDDTVGPTGAGTGTNQAGVGTVTWTNPGNVTSDDGANRAVASTAKNEITNYLQASNFGFNIAAGSTIQGITVEIDRSEGNTQAAGGIKDSEVKIVKADTTIGTTNMADASIFWPTSDTFKSYGGTSDVWGETWSATDVNDSDFGVVLSAVNTKVSGGGAAETARVDYVRITITYTPPAPNLTQIHSRWRNDNGNETAATWKRNEDVSANKNKSQNIRLRIEVSNEGYATATSTTYRIQYGQKSTDCASIGTWTDIPTSPTTEHFTITDSTYLTDASSTTNQLTAENTTFVAGQFKDSGNQASGISLTTSQYTEIEYTLQANNNSANGNNYCFRLTNAGSTTNFTYSQYPELTVGEPTIDQKHYRWRNDNGQEGGVTQTLYFNPTGDGFATNFTVASGCTNNWDCADDGSTDTSSTAPTNDGATSALTFANAKDYYTLADSAIPLGSTITQLDISAWVADTGNPNVTLTLGYCITCDGNNDVMGSGQAINNASYTEKAQQFTSLSLSTTDLNNLQLVVQGSGVKANISAVYVRVTYQEASASWKQNEDTAHSGEATLQNVRLRIEVANTGDVSANRNLLLEYAAKSGGSCGDDESFTTVPVSATTEHFEMTTSTYFADSDATTTQLTATGSFTAGKMIEDPSNLSGTITIGASQYTEVEYNFQAKSTATGSYCFLVTDNGTDLDVYSVYPEISIGTSNQSPNNPSSLVQKTTGDVTITTGQWISATSVKFTVSASDPDASDTLYLCVEKDILGTSFSNTEDSCGTGVAYSGSPVSATVTISSQTDASEYHWQARLKDTAGAYSSWISYDVNAESARDYGLDTTAPTGGSIYDGTSTGVDFSFNDGSLSSLSANWDSFDLNTSGLSSYEYSIGTTAGVTDIKAWTSNGTSTSITASSLTLQTSQIYYFNVRVNDNAGNSSIVSSNGQLVQPSLAFSLDTYSVMFANLNAGNSYTDSEVTTLTTSTNAYNGYVVRAYRTDNLRSTIYPSTYISDFSSGTYSAPSAWSGYGFGYTSSDTSIQGSAKFPLSGACLGTGTAPCYSPFSSSAPGDIVADHTSTVSGSAISNEQFNLTYKVATSDTQAAGPYSTTLVYTITAQY
jgi:hypothetical protein